MMAYIKLLITPRTVRSFFVDLSVFFKYYNCAIISGQQLQQQNIGSISFKFINKIIEFDSIRLGVIIINHRNGNTR